MCRRRIRRRWREWVLKSYRRNGLRPRNGCCVDGSVYLVGVLPGLAIIRSPFTSDLCKESSISCKVREGNSPQSSCAGRLSLGCSTNHSTTSASKSASSCLRLNSSLASNPIFSAFRSLRTVCTSYAIFHRSPITAAEQATIVAISDQECAGSRYAEKQANRSLCMFGSSGNHPSPTTESPENSSGNRKENVEVRNILRSIVIHSALPAMMVCNIRSNVNSSADQTDNHESKLPPEFSRELIQPIPVHRVFVFHFLNSAAAEIGSQELS